MIFGKKLNISLIESDVVWNDKKANLQNLEEKLKLIPKGTDEIIVEVSIVV